ncbi:MAG: hypothetical protein CM15mP128_4450 [Methanobacteriota archaeon]|nr:MAG: hypothetical protein CM15mP128_4450 [Euryarchaeota archaeon]
MGASVRSRDWDEVVDALGHLRTTLPPGDGSTHVPGLHLNEPRRGWAAFGTTSVRCFSGMARNGGFRQRAKSSSSPALDAHHRGDDHRPQFWSHRRGCVGHRRAHLQWDQCASAFTCPR